MQFLGRRSYIHACERRWGSADALLYGVLETCARSRANLRQILTSWSVFSYRAPAKNRLKTSKISELRPPYIQRVRRDTNTHLVTVCRLPDHEFTLSLPRALRSRATYS